MMKKVYNIFLMAVAMVTLAACTNDDLGAPSHPDEYYVMSFGVGAEQLKSKADADGCNDYHDWNVDLDPTSLAVTGYTNLSYTTTQAACDNNMFFNNQEVTYVPESGDGTSSQWTYSPLKYWADYSWADEYDFFASMPYKEDGMSVAKNDNAYTVTLTPTNTLAVDKDKNLLICREPNHQTQIGNVIQFHMDQTMAAFKLQFKVGDKMGNLRDFLVKKVEIYGKVATGATVSRTYTWNGSAWTAGDIVWAGGTGDEIAEGAAIKVPYKNNEVGEEHYYSDDATHTMRVTKDKAVQWGDLIYGVPDAVNFNPVIKVTYDVALTYDGEMSDYLIGGPGSYTKETIEDIYVLTRKDIVSTITFSKDYFTDLATAGKLKAGTLNTININIVPQFLYVLSDEDQSNKGMTITTK